MHKRKTMLMKILSLCLVFAMVLTVPATAFAASSRRTVSNYNPSSYSSSIGKTASYGLVREELGRAVIGRIFRTIANVFLSIVPSNNLYVTDVTLSPNSTTLIQGSNFTPTVTLAPNNRAKAKTIKWESDKSYVASVKDGRIYAEFPGTATITCTVDGLYRDTIKVTVLKDETPKYKVMYDINVPSSFTDVTGIVPTDDKYYKFGDTVTVLDGPQYNADNILFLYWNTKADGSGITYNPGDTFKIAANTTLYAQWTSLMPPQPQNKIEYDPNGGTDINGIAFSWIAENSTTVDCSGDHLLKTGYSYTGWNTEKDGSGTHYDYGDKLPGYDMTLYAEWEPIEYYIAFDGNGATSGSMTQMSLKYSETKNLNANAFVKNNYAFIGWNTEADGSGTSYLDGDEIINLTSTNGGVITLYAQWTPTTVPYIYYHANTGTSAEDATIENMPFPSNPNHCSTITYYPTYGAYRFVVSSLEPTRPGYTFTGWSDSPNGGTIYKPSTWHNTSNDVHLYAQWETSNSIRSESADLKINESGDTVEADRIEDSMLYKLIDDLSTSDSEWTAEIDAIEDTKPSDVAAKYEVEKYAASGYHVYGYYDPSMSSQHEINHWGKAVTNPDGTSGYDGYATMYFDGRGIGGSNTIAKYQNLKMCISLAHVFVGCDYGTYDDEDVSGQITQRNQLKIFEEYAKALWSSSHKIEPKISDVYACDSGCTDYNYKCNENKAYNLNTSDPTQNNYVCLRGSLVLYRPDGCVAKTHSHNNTSYTEVRKYESPSIISGTEGSLVSKTAQVTYYGKDYDTSIKYNSACTDYTIKTYSEHTSSSICNNLITVYCDGGCSHEVSIGKPADGCDNYLIQHINEVHSEADVALGDCPTPNTDGTCPGHSRDEYVCLSHDTCPGHTVCGGHAVCNGHHYCPGHDVKICLGHVDVDVESMITGITNPEILDGAGEVLVIQDTSLFNESLVSDNFEVRNGLLVYDYNKVKEKVGFEGWTKDNIDLALECYNADWYDLYGIEFATIQGMPLETKEIADIVGTIDFTQMSEKEAQHRQEIISCALESVGKIPYYWGGTASAPGYNGNNFGSRVTADYKGRTSKGLDSAHWIDWVYWSAIGDNLGNGNTHTLCSSSKLRPITKSSLKPGDILLLDPTGRNAHAGIFIKWNDDGTMMYITANGSPVNNVVVGNGALTWTHFYTYVGTIYI